MSTSQGIAKRLAFGAATAALLVAAGCSSGAASSSAQMALAPHSAASQAALKQASGARSASGDGAATGAVTGNVAPVLQPDIIRTGTVSLIVSQSRIMHAFDQASADAASEGGFVASSTSDWSGTPKPSASLEIRVPGSRFGSLIGEIDGLGKVQSQQLQGQDVTGQVVNLGARIANLQSEQVALRQLMSRAGTIPDILQVENQLFSVEQQIEVLTAEQSSLVGQVTYATVDVELSATAVPAKPKPKPAPVNAAVHAGHLAVHNTAAALHAVAIAIGAAFPALVVALAVLVVLGLRRRRLARLPKSAPNPAS